MKHYYKTILAALLGFITAFAAATSFSCNKDKCRTTTCANGGVCNGGTCTCSSGYEGTTCATASCDKFIGNWNQPEIQSASNGALFPVSVSRAAGITGVIIKNFGNYFSQPINAYVSHHDSLIIPIQGWHGKTVEGYCYYANSNDITVHYNITDSATNIVTTIDTKW